MTWASAAKWAGDPQIRRDPITNVTKGAKKLHHVEAACSGEKLRDSTLAAWETALSSTEAWKLNALKLGSPRYGKLRLQDARPTTVQDCWMLIWAMVEDAQG